MGLSASVLHLCRARPREDDVQAGMKRAIVGVPDVVAHRDRRRVSENHVARRWPAVKIADVYVYDALYHYVTHTIPSEPHIDLIETLIEKLSDFVFADDRVQDLRIDCSKPNVLEHATGVGVSAYWERAEWLAVSASTSIVR